MTSIARTYFIGSAYIQIEIAFAEEVDALLGHEFGERSGTAGRHRDELFEFRMQTFDQRGECRVHIIGVSSVHATAMHDSWKAGRIIEHKKALTIADGIAVRIPIPEAVWDMDGLVDAVLLVEESSIIAAMKFLLEEERLVVEPAGAAGIASLVEHADLKEYRRIGTVLCGSNMTQDQIKTWLLE
jgi:threonine dehydratase